MTSELPDDQGPFSLHDAAALEAALAPGGWADIRPEVHRLALPFAGHLSPAEAAVVSLDFGPTRLVTADLDEATRAAVADAIAGAFADHVDGHGHVVLGGTILVTTAARRP